MEWVWSTLGRAEAEKRAVLVTGCDYEEGFRSAIVHALATRGFVVVAACFTNEGVQRWKESARNMNAKRVATVKCDITSNTCVRNCVEFVADVCKREEVMFYALVNSS